MKEKYELKSSCVFQKNKVNLVVGIKPTKVCHWVHSVRKAVHKGRQCKPEILQCICPS